jgi:hypothetical protein
VDFAILNGWMVTEEVRCGRLVLRGSQCDASWRLGFRCVAAALYSAALLGCGLSNPEPSRNDATARGGDAGSAGSRGELGGGAGTGGHAAGNGGTGNGGTGNGGTGNGGTGNGGTGNGGAAPSSEFFIEGVVGGERIVAASDVRAFWYQGLVPGWLLLEAQGENISWTIMVREGTVNQSCGTATITLIREDTGSTMYFLSGWNPDSDPCTLVVAEPPGPVGEVIEGTFAASLSLAAQPGIPTNGSFRVPRLPDEPPAN